MLKKRTSFIMNGCGQQINGDDARLISANQKRHALLKVS